jgi:hypothetical protein
MQSMLKKYTFIPIFSCLIFGLSWWATKIHLNEVRPFQRNSSSGSLSKRKELIEVLDRIVAYEYYYHSVYGHFTKLLNRVGMSIPNDLADLYDVRVVEATTDHLLITALSEAQGKLNEIVSIDQDFLLHSNFDLPEPRAAYLKSQALKHMRLLRDAPSGQSVAEQGVFRGYFEYTLKTDSHDRKIVLAKGVRSPVRNLHLELDDSNENIIGSEGEFGNNPLDPMKETPSYALLQVGQKPEHDILTTLEEEAYLAQQIFYGEMGRYARNWSELSKIANFKFEGKDQFADPNLTLRKEDSPEVKSSLNRTLTSFPRANSLEIEPILDNE